MCVPVSRSEVNEKELISGENIDNERTNDINAPFVSKCGFVFLSKTPTVPMAGRPRHID